MYSLNTAKMSGTFTPQSVGPASRGARRSTSPTRRCPPIPTRTCDPIDLTSAGGSRPGDRAGGVDGDEPIGGRVERHPQRVLADAVSGNRRHRARRGARADRQLPDNDDRGHVQRVGADPPAISWTVRGANGGTTTTNSAAYTGKSKLIVSPVSASVSFAGAGGYPIAATVPNGTEPAVGSDADVTNGNAYDYKSRTTVGHDHRRDDHDSGKQPRGRDRHGLRRPKLADRRDATSPGCTRRGHAGDARRDTRERLDRAERLQRRAGQLARREVQRERAIPDRQGVRLVRDGMREPPAVRDAVGPAQPRRRRRSSSRSSSTRG